MVEVITRKVIYIYMYFWRIKLLKEDIKEGRFSEKERFLYLLWSVLGGTIMGILIYMPGTNTNMYDVISSLGSGVIMLTGTCYAYKANGGKDGADLLGRYVSIGFVTGIRFLPLLFVLFFLIGIHHIHNTELIGADYDPEHQESSSTLFSSLIFLLWYCALYFRICKHIGDVSNVTIDVIKHKNTD